MSKRSAMTPPHAPNINIGRNCKPGFDAEHEAVVVGQAEDQPRLREALHPGAADRDHLAGEVEAVVAVAERREGRRARAGARGSWGGSSVSRSSSIAARASRSRSSGVNVLRWRREIRVAVTADRLDERAAFGGRFDQRDPPVVLAARARREALLHERVDDARDRRRLDPLGFGELRKREPAVARRRRKAPRAATG